jgi:hypothetical protein
MANQCEPPPLVADEPRYRQERFVPWVNLGETPTETPPPVWNLDGVPWHEASWSKFRHKHRAQTVVVIDGEVVRRCPCGVHIYA